VREKKAKTNLKRQQTLSKRTSKQSARKKALNPGVIENRDQDQAKASRKKDSTSALAGSNKSFPVVGIGASAGGLEASFFALLIAARIGSIKPSRAIFNTSIQRRPRLLRHFISRVKRELGARKQSDQTPRVPLPMLRLQEEAPQVFSAQIMFRRRIA
jgi:hypothetical protein